MGLFKKKKIEERIKSKWQVRSCSLQQLQQLLESQALIELWVRCEGRYFQLGTSCEYEGNHPVNKVFYINLETDKSLFKRLNEMEAAGDTFFMAPHFANLLEAKMFGGKTLAQVWPGAQIVGVDEMDPENFTLL